MPFSPTSAHSRACIADRVELVGTKPSSYSSRTAFGCRLIPTPSGFRFGDGLEHEARHADLLQRERDAESADSATGDEYGQVGHQDSLSRASSADENPRLPGAAQDPSVVVV